MAEGGGAAPVSVSRSRVPSPRGDSPEKRGGANQPKFSFPETAPINRAHSAPRDEFHLRPQALRVTVYDSPSATPGASQPPDEKRKETFGTARKEESQSSSGPKAMAILPEASHGAALPAEEEVSSSESGATECLPAVKVMTTVSPPGSEGGGGPGRFVETAGGPRSPAVPRSLPAPCGLTLVSKYGVRAGEVLQALMDEQIFLGMAGLKTHTEGEVPHLIDAFMHAGVRFVYFGRESEKKVRTVGSSLGLETGWNCLISLTHEPRERTNQDGKVVLPSGITDIRRHLIDIDTVPLRVSLFCNGNPQNVREMISILQENSEVVTVVGSALRPSNFSLFEQADTAVSISVGPHPVCRCCHGKRWLGSYGQHAAWDGSAGCGASHPLAGLGSASAAELRMSGALTSLPCSLSANHVYLGSQVHATLELLFSACKEARRCVDAIQQALVFYVCSSCLLAVILLLQALAGLPPPIDGMALLVLLLVELPVLALALLASPASDTIMSEYPLKAREEMKKTHAKTTQQLIHYAVRFLPTAFVIIGIFLLIAHATLRQALEDSGVPRGMAGGDESAEALVSRLNEMQASPLAVHMVEACQDLEWQSWVRGSWVFCVSAYKRYVLGVQGGSIDESILKEAGKDLGGTGGASVDLTKVDAVWVIDLPQQVVLLCTVIFVVALSASHVDRFESLYIRPPCVNAFWLAITVLLLVLHSLACALEILLCDWNISEEAPRFLAGLERQYGAGGWGLALLGGFWIGAILLVDEIVKAMDRRSHRQLQKYLKVVFDTRLGMWSPK